MNLGTVVAKLGIAFAHGIDGLVALQPVTLETKALGEILDLAAQDELNILLAQVAFALRAMDGLIRSVLHQLENELAFALRALEDFGQHDDLRIGLAKKEFQS